MRTRCVPAVFPSGSMGDMMELAHVIDICMCSCASVLQVHTFVLVIGVSVRCCGFMGAIGWSREPCGK